MNDQDAIRIADEFLDKYTLRDEFFESVPDSDSVTQPRRDTRIWVQLIDMDGSSVRINFSVADHEDPEDPELQAIVRATLDALRKAHPELATRGLTHDML